MKFESFGARGISLLKMTSVLVLNACDHKIKDCKGRRAAEPFCRRGRPRMTYLGAALQRVDKLLGKTDGCLTGKTLLVHVQSLFKTTIQTAIALLSVCGVVIL